VNLYQILLKYVLGVFSGITLILQFLAMLWHRWATLRHIMSATELTLMCNQKVNQVTEAEDIARELQRTNTLEEGTHRRQLSLKNRYILMQWSYGAACTPLA